MKFAAREDIEVPIATVFSALSDFGGLERAALRRGASVVRTGTPAEGVVGSGWSVRFRYRGRERHLTTRIDRYEPPTGLTTSGSIGGLGGVLLVDLTALAPRRTRVRVELDLKPVTLTARILVQSLRLAKASLNQRLRARLARFGRDLEARSR